MRSPRGSRSSGGGRTRTRSSGRAGVWREAARLVSRPCRRRRPSSLDDGGISGLFSSGGPSVRFLTRYDGEVREPLVGRQGSRVSMRVARGSASLLPSHGRGIWPRDALKEVSRGLSRVEAGNPGFPRLVQVTSGGFSWWLGEARETGGGPLGTPRGLVHWKRASSPVEAGTAGYL